MNKKIFTLLGALLSATLWTTTTYGYNFPEPEPPKPSSETVRAFHQMSKGVAELAGSASKAIVFVSVSKTLRGRPLGEVDPFEFFFGPQYRNRRPERKQKGLGSGFFVDLDKGYVITNNHVIEGADEISLKLANGKVYDAKVLGRDQNTDVAVVQIKDEDYEKKGLTDLKLGDSDILKVGEFVLALGAPFGLESSISFGVLSARGRGNLNITTLGNFLQTDAAINPGNSGGPLLNSVGQVIGMNTAIYSRSGSSAGIGFAVPSNLVRKIASQLINHGDVSRGYLGVRLQPLDKDMAVAFDLPEGTEGVLVAYVQPGTPAAKAGLQDGDVIVKVDNLDVKSQSDLTNAIGLKPPGTKVNVTYYRQGKLKTASAKLADFPKSDQISRNQPREQKNKTAGLTLKAFHPNAPEYKKLKNKFNLTSSRGLVVLHVSQGSKAFNAGIQPGDLLLKANHKKLRKLQDFRKTYKSGAGKILVQLERNGDFLFASIRK